MNRGERRKILKGAGLERISHLHFDMFAGTLFGTPVWVVNPQGEGKGAKRAKPKLSVEQQKWIDCGDYYLGHWILDGDLDSPPKPRDLERAETTGTKLINIHGNSWQVPVIPIDFPSVFVMGPERTWTKKISEQFAPYMPLVDKYWQAELNVKPMREKLDEMSRQREAMIEELDILEEDREKNETKIEKLVDRILKHKADITKGYSDIEVHFPGFAERCDDCVKMLGVNYYLWQYEVSLLELLSERECFMIVYVCFLDEDAIKEQEEAKKKESPTQSVTAST